MWGPLGKSQSFLLYTCSGVINTSLMRARWSSEQLHKPATSSGSRFTGWYTVTESCMKIEYCNNNLKNYHKNVELNQVFPTTLKVLFSPVFKKYFIHYTVSTVYLYVGTLFLEIFRHCWKVWEFLQLLPVKVKKSVVKNSMNISIRKYAFAIK